MFNEELAEISEKLIYPYINECDRQVGEMIYLYAKENKQLPSLINCMEEIEFYNTQIIDDMIETYMGYGEGYILCHGPRNTWDDCGRCENYSACYTSILESNIMPFFREVFDDISITSMVFGSLRHSGTCIYLDKYAHRLYGDFADCFGNDNQIILDTMYYLNDNQTVYANHCQMTMFGDLFSNTSGSIFRFGDNSALMYGTIGYGYTNFYLEQEEEHVRIDRY